MAIALADCRWSARRCGRLILGTADSACMLHVGMAHASRLSPCMPAGPSGGWPRQAAENGNLEMVKTLIERKADVGCVREDGQVSLLLAAARGKVRAPAL